MSEFDKLLEQVAREWDLHACGDDACELEGADCLAEYLKRRLLPLLEAGQAMREWSYSVTSYEDNVPYVNGKYDANVERVQDAYDKQKQAAMEGRCSTSHKQQ